MAKKDIFHTHVRQTLEENGWSITHDPYKIKVGGVYQEIDLGAEMLIAAEREGEKIAVEVKSFIDKSPVTSFHEALGQFRNYRRALRQKDPDRKLFLAVPERTYNTFFQKPFIQEAIIEEELHLIIYSTTENNIIAWIN